MAKRKSKSVYGKFSGMIIFLLTVVTIVMLFLPNVAFNKDSEFLYKSITGLKAAFGWSETTGSVTITNLNFSILNTLGYALPLIGVVLAILLRKSKLFNLISFLCFVAGAVLLFLAPQTLVYANEGIEILKKVASLEYGAIVAGITSALSAVCVLLRFVLK